MLLDADVSLVASNIDRLHGEIVPQAVAESALDSARRCDHRDAVEGHDIFVPQVSALQGIQLRDSPSNPVTLRNCDVNSVRIDVPQAQELKGRFVREDTTRADGPHRCSHVLIVRRWRKLCKTVDAAMHLIDLSAGGHLRDRAVTDTDGGGFARGEVPVLVFSEKVETPQ